MRLKGFAMADGISFIDGKIRYTGRRLPDGKIEIRQGGSWFRRFTFRQKIALLGLIILTVIDYGWKGINDYCFFIIFLLIAPFAFHLSADQKRYHGAEHIAVNLYEGRRPSVFHPGCGSNLVLMLLPGLLLELLPWSIWITLACEVAYLYVVLKILWPAFQHGIRNEKRLAKFWWRLGSRWQQLFVAEPKEDEVQLAVQTLHKLFENNSV